MIRPAKQPGKSRPWKVRYNSALNPEAISLIMVKVKNIFMIIERANYGTTEKIRRCGSRK
ncbi:MAG TPA: hypothetical protein DF613_03785 [Lachnospiraceae bacterium]|nr:hypothetical protein [Lachnospiraceae bacterium]